MGVARNPLLKDLDGFAKLAAVGGDFMLDGLPRVESLAALAALKTVRLNLVVTDMSALKDLQVRGPERTADGMGWGGMGSAGGPSRRSLVRRCPPAQGLDALESVGLVLNVGYNQNLQSLKVTEPAAGCGRCCGRRSCAAACLGPGAGSSPGN